MLAVTEHWTRHGTRRGSNPGGTYRDQAGVLHYVKQSATPDHARNEVLAARLYQLAGIPCADLRLVHHHGAVGTASPIVATATTRNARAALRSTAGFTAELQAGLAVDAWLGNWDVIGAGFENVVVDDHNRPVRIDLGGALLYRARGAPKGTQFARIVVEWDTLRRAHVNRSAAAVFAGMTIEQLRDSARRVLDIPAAAIDDAVSSAGFAPATTDHLATTLDARRADIAIRAAALTGRGG